LAAVSSDLEEMAGLAAPTIDTEPNQSTAEAA
jgi:hypothetical protein